MIGKAARLRRSETGATAMEFAFVLPVFVSMLIGIMYSAMLGYNYIGLRNAVDDAVRCAAVKTTVCSDSTSTQNYAKGRFIGAGIPTPTFTPTMGTATCGSGANTITNAYQVTGTVTFNFNFIFKNIPITLTAQACYP